ncbi:MAG: tRNA preQ1(34) S-adenosylmethionine ribosyltransferase-isomerase QueA [Opitutaceae bacterium]|nr:tRNA preQ1(34) S-adenosylmethionine ribosyltransferase-isomerase QueA [Opitutaceae bacterium]
METSLFDYDLPRERIAQQPAAERDASRLLVVHRKDRTIEHRHFSDLIDYVRPSDQLFRNAARVLPARIFACRPTGGRVECLLLRPDSSQAETNCEDWWCLLKPGRKLPVGSTFALEGAFSATVAEKNEQAEYRVRFELPQGASVARIAESLGKMPLPPYIEREREDNRDRADKDRYQTIYAHSEKAVAAAAPTAGLHFTEALTRRIEATGAIFHDLTLHVGMGTFKPLDEGSVENHEIHREIYEIPVDAQRALRQAPEANQRRICVGTTSVRTVEDYLRKTDRIHDSGFMDEAGLFLYPPATFSGVDALITNFHMPKSTLLCLVSAFLSPGNTDGIDWLKSIYAEAIRMEYRFLSYGDAMLIL